MSVGRGKFLHNREPTMFHLKARSAVNGQRSCDRRRVYAQSADRTSFIIHRSSFPLAFTLVELLVVMMIMGILASIVLFALAGVQESARYDKTVATINKLNALIMAKYETYR